MTYYSYAYNDMQDIMYYLSNYGNKIGNFSFINLAWLVFKIVTAYLVLEKAGERGWKGLIPFYKDYIEYKLYWSTFVFWFSLIVPFIAIVLVCLAAILRNEIVFVTVCVVIACILLIVSLGIKFALQIKKGVCFGEPKSFGIGLILLNTIFVAILAFDKKCVYQGNATVVEDTPKTEEASQEDTSVNQEENPDNKA